MSVIIPVYNNAEGLRQTLAATKQQNYGGGLEIIVVDNNSTDGSDAVALEAGAIVVYQRDIQNAAASRNRGLAIATGAIVAFTDADCLPAPDWLTEGVKALSEHTVDRVAGEILVRPITPASSVSALLDVLYYFHQEKVVQAYGATITANFLAKRGLFKQIGDFDATFDELEDIEWGLRATAKGIAIAYAPTCIVIHPPRSTIKELWKKSRRYGRGIFSVCQQQPAWAGKWGWKHPLRVLRILVLPRVLYWDRLPFAVENLCWQKQWQVNLLLWLAINLAEANGYFDGYMEWWARYVRHQLSMVGK